jgi:hypothetical protein
MNIDTGMDIDRDMNIDVDIDVDMDVDIGADRYDNFVCVVTVLTSPIENK